MTLSVPQITAQLEAVLAREPGALAVAIRSATKQDWPDAVTQRGRRFSLRWCDSMLASVLRVPAIRQSSLGTGLIGCAR
jgi:hypothetical protein